MPFKRIPKLVFSAVYFAFGIINQPIWLYLLFPIYGVYIAVTDGVSKAYLSEFIEKKQSATYFGAYYTLTAIGTFFASLIGGLLWYKITLGVTFIYGSVLALLAFIVLLTFRRRLL